jgi:hypothetical protein
MTTGNKKGGDTSGCHGGSNKHPINSLNYCMKPVSETKYPLDYWSAQRMEWTHVNATYVNWFCS